MLLKNFIPDPEIFDNPVVQCYFYDLTSLNNELNLGLNFAEIESLAVSAYRNRGSLSLNDIVLDFLIGDDD